MSLQPGSPYIINPYEQQLEEIAKRKALAQALQQQSFAPQQQNTVGLAGGGQFTVRNGLGPVLAQILQGYVGGKMSKREDEEAQKVRGEQQKAQGDWFSKINELRQPDPLSEVTINSRASGTTPESQAINQRIEAGNAQANANNEASNQARQAELLNTLANGGQISPIAGNIGSALLSQELTPKAKDYKQVDLGDRIVMLDGNLKPVGEPLLKNMSPTEKAKVEDEWKRIKDQQTFQAGENQKTRDTQLEAAKITAGQAAGKEDRQVARTDYDNNVKGIDAREAQLRALKKADEAYDSLLTDPDFKDYYGSAFINNTSHAQIQKKAEQIEGLNMVNVMTEAGSGARGLSENESRALAASQGSGFKDFRLSPERVKEMLDERRKAGAELRAKLEAEVAEMKKENDVLKNLRNPAGNLTPNVATPSNDPLGLRK